MPKQKISDHDAASDKREIHTSDRTVTEKKRFHTRKLIQSALMSVKRAECRKTNRSLKRLSDALDGSRGVPVASKKRETLEKLSVRLAWMKSLTASDLLHLTGVPDTSAQEFIQPKPSKTNLDPKQQGMLQKFLQNGDVKKLITHYATLFQPDDDDDDVDSDSEMSDNQDVVAEETAGSGTTAIASGTPDPSTSESALEKALAKLKPLPDDVYATDSTSSEDDADAIGERVGGSLTLKGKGTATTSISSGMFSYDDISDYDDDVADTFASGDVDPSATAGQPSGIEGSVGEDNTATQTLDDAEEAEGTTADVSVAAPEPTMDDPMFVSSLSSLSTASRGGKGSRKRKHGGDAVASVLSALMQHPAKTAPTQTVHTGAHPDHSEEKPKKKRKKRLGQMARQKRAEKLYGERARHVVNPTIDANKRQDLRRQQKREGKGKAKGPHTDKGNKKGGGGHQKQEPASMAEEDGGLHPSWAAKRGLGDVAIKKFSGTKISFGDDGSGSTGGTPTIQGSTTGEHSGNNRHRRSQVVEAGGTFSGSLREGAKGQGQGASRSAQPSRATPKAQKQGRQSWEAKQRMGLDGATTGISTHRNNAAGTDVHPSWSAKAAEGVIKPFSGTKITFD
eukprot:m.1035470 g.1035470  ORF g.1035470 m.1035470 type:complete len:622 (+) comp24138_c3_seq2:184-2049(+)